MHALAMTRGRKADDEPDPNAPLRGATLADRIKNARLRAGLKKAVLAAACEVAWQTVNNWEKGMSVPTLENFAAIAQATGFSISQIQGDADVHELAPALQRALATYARADELTPQQIQQIAGLKFTGGPPTEPTRYIRIMEDMLGDGGPELRGPETETRARTLGVKKVRRRKA